MLLYFLFKSVSHAIPGNSVPRLFVVTPCFPCYSVFLVTLCFPRYSLFSLSLCAFLVTLCCPRYCMFSLSLCFFSVTPCFPRYSTFSALLSLLPVTLRFPRYSVISTFPFVFRVTPCFPRYSMSSLSLFCGRHCVTPRSPCYSARVERSPGVGSSLPGLTNDHIDELTVAWRRDVPRCSSGNRASGRGGWGNLGLGVHAAGTVPGQARQIHTSTATRHRCCHYNPPRGGDLLGTPSVNTIHE